MKTKSKTNIVTQVDKTHYRFQTYSTERRFISYYHQVQNAYQLIEANNLSTVLVIGKGDGVVPKILEAYSDLFGINLRIDTFDFAADLKPTINGDIRHFSKLVKKKYDLVICCQMLEHIPMEDALQAIKDIKAKTNYFIISLPYKALTIRGTLKVPVLPELEFCWKWPIFKKKGMVDERHYWELGCSISVDDFIKKLETMGYQTLKSYIVKKHGNHYFIVLNNKAASK